MFFCFQREIFRSSFLYHRLHIHCALLSRPRPLQTQFPFNISSRKEQHCSNSIPIRQFWLQVWPHHNASFSSLYIACTCSRCDSRILKKLVAISGSIGRTRKHVFSDNEACIALNLRGGGYRASSWKCCCSVSPTLKRAKIDLIHQRLATGFVQWRVHHEVSEGVSLL